MSTSLAHFFRGSYRLDRCSNYGYQLEMSFLTKKHFGGYKLDMFVPRGLNPRNFM